MKKLTKKEKFAILLEMSEVKGNTMLVDFITNEIELLEKKSGKSNGKPTKTQEENAILKKAILRTMENGAGYQVKELIKIVPELAAIGATTQKGTPLCNQLVDEGFLSKEKVKGVMLYTKVEQGE